MPVPGFVESLESDWDTQFRYYTNTVGARRTNIHWKTSVDPPEEVVKRLRSLDNLVGLKTSVDSYQAMYKREVGELGFSGSMLMFVVQHHGSATLFLWSEDVNEDFDPEEVKQFQDLFPKKVVEDSGKISVTFWNMNSSGSVNQNSREITVPTWAETERNYPESVRSSLQGLINFTPQEGIGGKLIIWTGIPGTGKTYAIRTLLREWKERVEPHYIMDPERFLNESDYLQEVLMEQHWTHDEDEGGTVLSSKWRLVILEDSGELLTKDARQYAGQALSRLLNATEGFIGEGVRVLFLITTNEEVGQLHEAVVRPGRAIQNLKFEPFTVAESAEWCEAHETKAWTKMKSSSPLAIRAAATLPTLADLYAHMQGSPIEQAVL